MAGESWHRFAESLPLQLSENAACLECETHPERWEGPQVPRLYGFSARHVAQALIRVAGRQQELYKGPSSVGPIEEQFRVLGNWLGDRAAQFTNKRQLDRLLMLMTCHMNGEAKESEWSGLIRTHLEALGAKEPTSTG